MEYNKEIVYKMYNQYNIEKGKYKKMYDYYIGKTDTKLYYPTTDRSNIKVTDNFIKSFIDEEVSFMVGQPITYTSRSNNKEIINDLEYYLNNIDTTIDTKLATNLLIYGKAYEFYYINNLEFKIKSFSPLNSYAYCDEEGKVQLFMYFYKKDLDDKIYIELIDDNYIYHLNDSLGEIAPPTPHYFEEVPVGVAKLTNGRHDTLYNNIKSMQDDYEHILSDWANEISDTRLSYLMLTGIELDDETATDMKKKGILQIVDPNGKAGFLTKDLNCDYVKSHIDIINNDMYRSAQHINNQTQIQSNTSGNMLSVRMNCLRIKITTQNQALKNCIKTRLKCLFTFLYKAERKFYDYKDIIIKPQLNLPQNDTETAQILSQLNGKLSIRTGLERLSFITNGNDEFNKMLEEQKMIQENEINSMDDLDKTEDIDKEVDLDKTEDIDKEVDDTNEDE